MKIIITLSLLLGSTLAQADLNRFPRFKIVTGNRAEKIFTQLTEGARPEHNMSEVRAGGAAAVITPVAKCPGASFRTGYFKPSFWSTFDNAGCRSEKGETVCILSTSGHEPLDSKRKSEKSEKSISACGDLLASEACVATDTKGLIALCESAESQK